MKNLPKDLKKKIVCDAIVANKLFSNGDGTFRGSLANNISEENARRIIARMQG